MVLRSTAARPRALWVDDDRLWWLTYVLFVGGVGAVEHPQRGFEAKSVLLADTYEKPVAWAGVAYPSVCSIGGEPVLVPFPIVPDVLLAPPPDASFECSRAALRALAGAMVDRVNLVVPVARAQADNA